MTNYHFIITGTSRGIGEQLAKMLLEADHHVYGISRSQSNALATYNKYTHTTFDLSHTVEIESKINDLFKQIPFRNFEMICLINNAAMLEPLKSIEECSVLEINKNLQISLIAPIVLTSCFIKQTNHFQGRRKIINISSGSGKYPAPDMSVYCTAKAGLNMFTHCVGAEQKSQPYPVEIIAVDPGMVETEMQKLARGKNEEDFEMSAFFKMLITMDNYNQLKILGSI
ncbi:MAG: SDR family NAD(P)-dependent oxidoreductase [Bacillota bacterium]